MNFSITLFFQDVLHAVRFLVIILIPFLLGPAVGWGAGQAVALSLAPAQAEPLEPLPDRLLKSNRYSTAGAAVGLVVGPMLAGAIAKRLERGHPDIEPEEPKFLKGG